VFKESLSDFSWNLDICDKLDERTEKWIQNPGSEQWDNIMAVCGSNVVVKSGQDSKRRKS
jgi:hypothetical protein